MLSRYADSRKSFYLDPILLSLQRLERLFIHQIEQSTLNCLIAENLYNQLAEHQMSSNESIEVLKVHREFLCIFILLQAKPIDASPLMLGRPLDLYHHAPQFLLPKDPNSRRSQRKSPKLNESANTNANTNSNINENSNVNFNRHHRRSFDGGDSNSARNKNVNSNINFNSNSNKNRDIFDFSDEDED
ncbi:basic-leucine zipper transcription factor A [Cardiocondyla obscurior]|uniref:basic-leucine zipper transcription factor A n=1 Tax=Cardiocondyla obscurior TaxID=286306 RepID=UPI003965664C